MAKLLSFQNTEYKAQYPLLQTILMHLTVTMLARALGIMLQALGLDTGLYSLHSLCKGGTTATYGARANQLDIKRLGIWSSDAFWAYFMAPCVPTSPVVRALAAITSVCVWLSRILVNPPVTYSSKCIFCFLTLYLLHLKFYFTI